MTITNQAFIKAYRHDTAQPTPASHAPARPGRPAAVAMEAAVEYVAATSYGTSTSVQPDLPGPLVTAIDVVPYSSATTFQIPAPVHQGAASSDVADACLATRRADQPAPAKRPLSSYIAHHRATPSIVRAAENSNSFRAGTTVASFRWPDVCRALWQQSAGEFDRLGEQLWSRADRGQRLIGILGLFPGSGCTTTALAIAARMARSHGRVILIDGNFSKPRLATWLEVVPTAGWEEVLREEASLSDAVIHSKGDRLDVLALGAKFPHEPLGLASAAAMAVNGDILRSAYDVALIDLGAFFNARSQPVVLELVRNLGIELVLAVTGREEADPRDLAMMAKRLEGSGCEPLGIVENRVAKPRADRTASRTSDFP